MGSTGSTTLHRGAITTLIVCIPIEKVMIIWSELPSYLGIFIRSARVSDDEDEIVNFEWVQKFLALIDCEWHSAPLKPNVL